MQITPRLALAPRGGGGFLLDYSALLAAWRARHPAASRTPPA